MKKLIALLTALLTTVGLSFAAAPASAYPPGQTFKVIPSSTSVDPNTSIQVYATKAYPGCTVTFTSTLAGKRVATQYSQANELGVTGDVVFNLAKLGIYSIKASFSCNGYSESSSVNVTAGRPTTTTITLVSAGTSKTFTASGSVKYGAFGVPGMSGSGLLKDPSGAKQSFTVTTDSNGNFTKSLTVRKIVPGNYTVSITFKNMDPYFGSTASNSLFKSASVTIATKAIAKGKIK